MTEASQHGSSPSPAEQRIAAIERAICTGSLALGGALFALGLLQVGAVLWGWTGHPDAMLLPLLASLPLLVAGTMLRLAAASTRRGAPRRWKVQWGMLLMAVVFIGVVALSVR